MIAIERLTKSLKHNSASNLKPYSGRLYSVMPPDSGMTAPVTKLPASDAR